MKRLKKRSRTESVAPTTVHHEDDMVVLHHGDALKVLRAMPDNSVHAVVTDPPYGLSNTDPKHVAETVVQWAQGNREHVPHKRGGFMGKEWDSFVPPVAVWDECFRVLKPGGYLLSFAGSRTIDLMTLSIRLAGFDIRDTIMWLYGSGFPKSMDVSKAIDKAADYRLQAAVRRAAVVAVEKAGLTLPGNSRHDWTVGEHAPGDKWWAEFQQWLPELTDEDRERVEGEIVATIRKSSGWFTQGDIYDVTAPATPEAEQWDGWGTALKPAFEPIVLARKPLAEKTVARNVLEHGTGAINVDACRIAATDKAKFPAGVVSETESVYGGGEGIYGDRPRPEDKNPSGRWPANIALDEEAAEALDEQSGSGTSRFFYVAKASKKERPVVDGVAHPTVKPIALMRWLVRMVTPPDGVVLDPFVGSGTTLEAAKIEGLRSVGIEAAEEYLPLAVERITRASAPAAPERSKKRLKARPGTRAHMAPPSAR